MVFTGERPNIAFVMWIEKSFAELSKIVFQCVGSKECDLWSEIRCCHDSFRACHVKSAAVMEFRKADTHTRCRWYVVGSSGLGRCYIVLSWNLRSFCITLHLYLFLNPKPSTISRTPFLVKKISQTFVSNSEKIARLIGEEIRYLLYKL